MKPADKVLSQIATTVHVTVEKDAHARWHAHSRDVFGLELCGRYRDEVVNAIPEAIQFLFKENHDIEVSVRRLCDVTKFPRPVVVEDEFLLETEVQDAA